MAKTQMWREGHGSILKIWPPFIWNKGCMFCVCSMPDCRSVLCSVFKYIISFSLTWEYPDITEHLESFGMRCHLLFKACTFLTFAFPEQKKKKSATSECQVQWSSCLLRPEALHWGFHLKRLIHKGERRGECPTCFPLLFLRETLCLSVKKFVV